MTSRSFSAYLVRRLLENGANSSFVNQIVDKSVPVADIARDPLTAAGGVSKRFGEHVAVEDLVCSLQDRDPADREAAA